MIRRRCSNVWRWSFAVGAPLLFNACYTDSSSAPIGGLEASPSMPAEAAAADPAAVALSLKLRSGELEAIAARATGRIEITDLRDERLQKPLITRDLVIRSREGEGVVAMPNVVVVTGDLTLALEASSCLTASSIQVALNPSEVHVYRLGNVIATCTDANGTFDAKGVDFVKNGADGVAEASASAGLSGAPVTGSTVLEGQDGVDCADSGTNGAGSLATPTDLSIGGSGGPGNTGAEGQTVQPTALTLTGTSNTLLNWYLMGGDAAPGQQGGEGGTGGVGQAGGGGGDGAQACCKGKCNPGQECNLEETEPPGAGGLGGNGGPGAIGGPGGDGGVGGRGGAGGFFLGMVNSVAVAQVRVVGNTGGEGGAGGRSGSGGAGGMGGLGGNGGLGGTHCDFSIGDYAAAGQAGANGSVGTAGYSGVAGAKGSNSMSLIIPLSSSEAAR